MVARILDGRPVARAIWDEVARRAERFRERAGLAPGLAIVQVGQDPASAAYAGQIERAFGGRGLATRVRSLPAGADEPEFAVALAQLAGDPAVHGILVELPLPAPLTFEAVVRHLPVEKDVEGIHPLNAGALAQKRPAVVPSTPLAGREILRFAEIPVAGKTAVVVGRSLIVGHPMAELLLRDDATVVICHSRTPDLGAFTRQADVLLAAAGRPGLISAAHVKPGATVIDFGTNVVDGRLVGDVEFDSVREIAGAITPVPGGTGPVTTALLGRNLLDLAERSLA